MTHMWWAPINDKICIKILVTLVLLTELVSSSPKRPTREYLKMRIEERIKYQGYPCDVHEITTPDGYNLYLYRVPYGVNPTKNFECDGEYININTNKEYVNDEYDEEYSQEERENKEYYDETTGFVEEKELANSTEIPVTRELTTSSTITTFKADTTRSYLSTARTTSPTISSLLQKPSTTVKRLTTTTVTSTTAAVTNPPTTTASISETTAGTSFSIDSTTTRASNAKTLEPITTSKPTENSTRKTFIQKIPKRPWRKPKRSNREPKEFRQNLVNNEKPSEKSVILLLHGMTGSPSNFIHNGKDGLAFYFADRGFDVWILCFRGNNCGQKKLHVKYDSDRDSEFWDFTFHHMASIDVPTAIDYILPKTNQSALHLIGHSAGTIIQILFLSERPEYASKVKIGSHYAGSVFTGMSDYPVLQLSSSLVNILKGVRKFFGWITVLPAEVFDMFMGFLVETCYSDQYFHVCEAMNSIVGSHKSVLVDKYASIPLLFHDSQMHLSHREVFHFMEMFATDNRIYKNLQPYPKDFLKIGVFLSKNKNPNCCYRFMYIDQAKEKARLKNNMTHMWWAPINDKICIKILVTLVLLTELVSSSPKRPTREYLKMRIEERIKYQGYPCDVHEITTPDGYNLYLYRVPYGVNPTKNFECDGEYININTNKEYVNDEYDEEYSQEERENKEYYDETTGFVEEKELANSTEIPVTRELTTSSTITTFKADTTRSYLSTARTTSPTISSLLQKPSTTVKRLTTTTVTSTTAAVTNPPTTTASISETTAGTSFSIDSTTTRASNAKTLEPITTSKPTENSTRKTFIQKIPKRPWRKPKRSNREPKEFRQNLVNNEKPSEKSVILLLHGMTGSPSNFIHNGKDGLAFYFADRGFDVWILCFRGNNCGQKKLHVKYDSDRDSEFWDFTFHHMASIDVPTAIDYILPKTNQSALHLIGHSAGTIIQILFLSERPEYASKVKIGSHYAGSVFTGMSDYPVLQLSSSLVNILKGVRKFFGWITVLPAEVFDMFMGFLVETCYSDQYFHVCEAMNSIVGSHKSVLVDKYASIPLLFHDSQMHLSHREVFHFMEMFATGECIKYNYGKKRNLREYGQETPPLYNFSRVINPIILHYSSADHFGNLADLKRAVPLLPNVIQVYKVPFWRFTHTDYILGKNASKLVYENTCQMFKRYDRGERWKRLTKVDIDEPLFW